MPRQASTMYSAAQAVVWAEAAAARRARGKRTAFIVEMLDEVSSELEWAGD